MQNHTDLDQTLLEQAVDAVFVADLDGRYISVNSAACALLGYPREELLGKGIVDLIPAVDRPRLQDVREHLLLGSQHRGEWRLIRSDGTQVSVDLTARIMPDGRWQAIVRDISERKRLEADLREAQRAATQAADQLRSVIEQAPDALILVDAQNHILLLNHQTELLFGYAREELLGQSLEILIPDRVREQHRSHQAMYWANPMARPMGAKLDLLGRRSDGSEVPIAVSLGPVQTDGELRILATCRDMTERKQMEQTLREQAEELTRTFEAMQEGVYIYDHIGQLVHMNAAARAIAGFDVHPEWEQMPSDERLRHFQPRDATGHPLPLEAWPNQRVLRGETLSSAAPVELVTTNLAGHEIVAHITGAPIHDTEGRVVGAVMVSHDMTEQRRLERALAERAQEIESIFETDADAVMLFDTRGRTLRMNAAQRRLLGYTAVGQMDYLTPEERARHYAFFDATGRPLPQEEWPIYRVLRGETLTGPHAVEMRLRTLDGRQIHVSVSGAPVLDPEGRVVGGVTASRDVTEQRHLEEQRLDILRMVAHDLGNPLTVLKLALQTQQRLLQRGLPARELDPELLASMEQSVGRMERLLADMRVMFGLEANQLSLDFRPCDLVALCQQEVAALRLAQGREVDVDVPDGVVLVKADRDRIGQVLGNLLSNADKYSPTDRPVTITLRIEPDPQVKPLGAAARRLQARIAVHDEGPGIPPQEQEHIWERFHRVAGVQARPGTGGSLGLGLFISREIIMRHGGTMGVESAPGNGSTFWCMLPLAPSQ